MSPYRSTHAVVAITFGVALLAGAASAQARGGGGHSAGMMSHPMSVTGMAVSHQSLSPPGSMPLPSMSPPSMSPPSMPPPGSSPGHGSSGHGSPGQSGSNPAANLGGVSFAAPTPITNTPSTGPSDTLGAMPELAPLPAPTAPLPTQFATGGSTGVNLALSPGSTAASQPSAPGGGGKSLAACMDFWDAGTHMNKQEWRAACLRTMEEFPTVN